MSKGARAGFTDELPMLNGRILAVMLAGFSVILPAQFSQAAPLTNQPSAAFSVSIVKSNSPNRVTLSLQRPTNAIVAGLNLYCGGDSGVYTNKINVGTNLTVTLTNLPSWSTYYFADTSYSSAGAESALSTETLWIAPPGVLWLKWSSTNKSFTVQSSVSPGGPWTNLVTTTNSTWSVTTAQSHQLFRLRGN